ncbi:hypothetical protein ABZP36_017912 [Zizania latifolia]
MSRGLVPQQSNSIFNHSHEQCQGSVRNEIGNKESQQQEQKHLHHTNEQPSRSELVSGGADNKHLQSNTQRECDQPKVNQEPGNNSQQNIAGQQQPLQQMRSQQTPSTNQTNSAPMNTFIGGNDTSSVTMHWAMAELTRNPRVLKKVQDEIRAVVGKKEQVQHDDMRKLKYLRMVVKETLRLHPPRTLLVPRETIWHIKVGGYDIPAKTKVNVNAWAIGRDPKVWKDPEEFCPDRFEETDIDFNGAHFELIPFGSGCQICPGLAMAVLNMEFILANMLFCFNWELPEGMRKEDIDMEEAGGGKSVNKKIDGHTATSKKNSQRCQPVFSAT